MNRKGALWSALLALCMGAGYAQQAPSPFFAERIEEEIPSFLFIEPHLHCYFGQDLNVGTQVPADPYSLFQYIFDFGIEKTNVAVRNFEHQTVSFTAKARLKQLIGHPGTGTFPAQEPKKFQAWLREGFLLYRPTQERDIAIQGGFFPFKVGNGFVLGNAYNINIPISWQYIDEQIDQFRPGALVRVSNRNRSYTVQAYVATTHANNFFQDTVSPTLSNFLEPLFQNAPSYFSKSVADITAALEVAIDPFDSHALQIKPYFVFQRNNQEIEVPNDTESTLYTPGLYAVFEHKPWRVSIEVARNCGHQLVKAFDRNITHNDYLYYDPTQGTSLTPAQPNSAFVLSLFALSNVPAANTASNGGTFSYPVSASNTFIFRNAYDRFRKSYKNKYGGWLAYADFLTTTSTITWAVVGAYLSGDDNPNDSLDTLLLTRLTPGVTYQDYNKTYKGFVSVDPYYEVAYLNPLYYGTGDFNYSNLAFVGSTFEYRWSKESYQPLAAQLTVFSYFKPHAVNMNIIDSAGTLITNPLPHYLGTEINYEITYSNKHDDLDIFLLGGVFFPGAYLKELKKQQLVIEGQTASIYAFQDPSLRPISDTRPVNHPFFISFGVVWNCDLMPSARTVTHG